MQHELDKNYTRKHNSVWGTTEYEGEKLVFLMNPNAEYHFWYGTEWKLLFQRIKKIYMPTTNQQGSFFWFQLYMCTEWSKIYKKKLSWLSSKRGKMKVSPERLEILFDIWGLNLLLLFPNPQGAHVNWHFLFKASTPGSTVFHYNIVPPNGSNAVVLL